MTEKDFNKIPSNDYCPFLSKLHIKEHKKLVEIAKLKNNGNKIYELHEKDSDTGTFGIFNNVKIQELVLADNRSYEGTFIKLFKTNFLSSLNTYALLIFVYITENLELNNNKIELTVLKLSIATGLSESRKIYTGLNELIEKNIIAKHNVKEIYYVNPAIIFRGSNRRVLFTHKNY